MSTILKEQIPVTNAWRRLSRIIENAMVTTYAQFGSDATLRKLAYKFKREFAEDAARSVGGFGTTLSAWTMKPRKLVYEAVLEQEGWTPSQFVLAVAKLMPLSSKPPLRICDLKIIAALQCRKNTKDLRDVVQPFNRGEKDSDAECPRFYWYPSSPAEVEARMVYNEALGFLGSLAKVRNIRLFSVSANETLARACKMHCDATARGVIETQKGVAIAELAAPIATDIDYVALRDDFAAYCEQQGKVASELSARAYLKSNDIEESQELLSFMMREAS